MAFEIKENSPFAKFEDLSLLRAYKHDVTKKKISIFLFCTNWMTCSLFKLEQSNVGIHRYEITLSNVSKIFFRESSDKPDPWECTEIFYFDLFYDADRDLHKLKIFFFEEDDFFMEIEFSKFCVKDCGHIPFEGHLMIFSSKGPMLGELVSSIIDDIPPEGPWLNEERLRREKPEHFVKRLPAFLESW